MKFLLTLGCERTMEANGYPWPPMLDCDKFPLDNDMCITSQAEAKQEKRPSQSKTIKSHGKPSLKFYQYSIQYQYRAFLIQKSALLRTAGKIWQEFGKFLGYLKFHINLMKNGL